MAGKYSASAEVALAWWKLRQVHSSPAFVSFEKNLHVHQTSAKLGPLLMPLPQQQEARFEILTFLDFVF